MASSKLLSLGLLLNLFNGIHSAVVSNPAVEHEPLAHSDAVSCAALPNVVDKLLVAGMVSDGTSLVSSNLYSVYYPAGANPTAAELFTTIPQDAFVPSDNKTGAIMSAKGWDVPQVIADSAYGEQKDSAYAKNGGLPSFCRFGGQIQTSDSGSRAHFEVWMPLSDSESQDESAKLTFQDAAGKADVKLSAVRRKSDALVAKSTFTAANTSGWTKRLLFMVGGGLRGTVAYPELKQAMARYRVAVAGTNMGHFSAANGTKWLPDNPEAWTDFGHRAVHLTTMVSQLSVKAFYGTEKLTEDLDGKHGESRSNVGFYSYLRGCSTGGRAAMAEVQKYPKDYDGVMSGCPAIDYNYLNAYQIHVNSLQSNKSSPAHISPATYPLINKAVLESCDAADGVKDSVISLPQDCKPDFAKLIGCTALKTTPYDPKVPEAATVLNRRSTQIEADARLQTSSIDPVDTSTDKSSMAAPGQIGLLKNDKKEGYETPSVSPVSSGSQPKGKDSPTQPKKASDEDEDLPAAHCLLDPQLENLKNIYSDYYIDGKLIREAVLPGSEFGWNVTKGVTGKTFAAAPGWFQYQVLGQKTWDSKSFDPYTQVTPEIIAQGQSMDPGSTIDFNPDLSEFFGKGGKLLHYHGLADQLVTSGVSSRYYDMVKAKLGGKDIQDKYQLYFVPGMQHCRGGTGPFNFGGAGQAGESDTRPLQYDAQHDMFLALIDWVEKDKAPTSFIGAAYKTKAGIAPATSGQETAFVDGVRNTRLLCPYPTQANLRSHSECSTDEACAFECK